MVKPREAEFKIIFPKRDNSQQKIKPAIYKKYAQELSERFGGTTIQPSVLGCFGDECEENLIMNVSRDFDSKDFKKKYPSCNNKCKIKVIKEDTKFIKNLSKKAGIELGQEAILVQHDDIKDISLIEGKRKFKISKSKIGEDLFKKFL